MSTGSLTPGVEYKLRNQNFSLINNCDKSGMMVGKVDIITGYDMAKKMVPSSSGTDGRNFTYFIAGVSTDNPSITSTSALTFINDGKDVSRCIPVSLGQNRPIGNTSQGRSSSLWIMPATQIYNPVFFVNKGDNIIVNYKLGFSPQTNDARASWQSLGTNPVGSYPGVAMIFGDFYIY